MKQYQQISPKIFIFIFNIQNKFYMDRNKNILRTFQAETDQFFKNVQAGHEKRGSYKKKKVYVSILNGSLFKYAFE